VPGTIGMESEQQFSIEEEKIEDSKITFEFSAPDDAGMRLYVVKRTVVRQKQLQGEVEFQDEGKQTIAKITLARVR
jgi:hypothetical protein